MFPTQPRRPEFWISFPFLAWNLEIYPRTHMWFFNQLWCTGTCACISNLNYAHKGDTFPPRTTSLLERSSDLQEAYTKICSYLACEGAHINNQQSHFGTSAVTLQSETQVLLKPWAFYLLVPFRKGQPFFDQKKLIVLIYSSVLL